MEQPFYVGLEQPAEFRKGVLFCVKDILTVLKEYEHYRHTSEEKKLKIAEFQQVMRELGILNNKLKKFFPKLKMKTKRPEIKITEKKAQMPQKSKLAVLEEQLDAIELKIQSLE